MPRQTVIPGRLRVSGIVLVRLVFLTLRDVEGIEDIYGITLVGGCAEDPAASGPIDAVPPASGGASRTRPNNLYTVGGAAPGLHLRLTARYGTALHEVAEAARRRLRAAVCEATGLVLGPIEVDFVALSPLPSRLPCN